MNSRKRSKATSAITPGFWPEKFAGKSQIAASRPDLSLILWLALSLLLGACGPNSQPETAITSSPRPGFDPTEISKIDTLLRDLLFSYKSGGGLEAARTYARERGLLDDQERIRFGLTLSGPGAVPGITARLQQMGGEVYQSHEAQLGVAVNLTKLTGYINNSDKRDFLEELAALKEVREVRVLLRPATDWAGLEQVATIVPNPVLAQTSPPPATAITSNEGVAVIGADKWQAAGFKGSGIKVGIIDAGFKNYRAGLGKTLPTAAQVSFRSFILGGGEGSEIHGVAVAEVVHSLAPDATLLLAVIEDEIGFAQAVDWLLESKVQIIQVSLGWAGLFPGDGTGKMAEQLDRARRQGVLPVVSAGNYGRSHYTAPLRVNEKGLQLFGTDNRLTLKLTAKANSAWVALRWDEKWENPQTNLDLYVQDKAGQALGSSRNEQGQNSPKPPTELVPFRTVPDQIYYIQVRLTGKPAATLPRLHLFAYNASLEESTAQGSVATPADARGAISVGAVNWHDDKLEEYSSRGPTSDGRLKPELVGPSQVSTVTLGQAQFFTGTSAAAPQVSGTAALLWSAAPGLNADQVARYLSRNARSLASEASLRDPATGYGRVRLGAVEIARRGPADLLVALPAGPVFQDDFSRAASGLPDNAAGYYGKLPEGTNAYFIRAGEPGLLNWSSYLQKSYEEFQADFEVIALPAEPALFYGLVFWQQGPQDYYAFVVAADRFALLRRKGQEWLSLIDWRHEAALSRNGLPQSLSLSLEATASYIRLRAGDTILQSLALKEAQPGGRFGFMAGSFELKVGYNAFAAFSKLTITPLTTQQT